MNTFLYDLAHLAVAGSLLSVVYYLGYQIGGALGRCEFPTTRTE